MLLEQPVPQVVLGGAENASSNNVEIDAHWKI